MSTTGEISKISWLPGERERTIIEYPDFDQDLIAECAPVSDEHVRRILDAGVGTDNTRSEWLWIRTVNGDLIFGCFPQGDLYFDTEVGRPL